MVDTKVTNLLRILVHSVKWRLSFIHNKMLSYPLATQLNWAYLENQGHSSKSWNSFHFIENVSIYCFDLVQMAAILDFTRNAISKVRSGHTPMSDMLGNLWYTPEVWFCFYFIKINYINLLFHLAKITAILDFINNAMSFLTTLLCQT